MLSELERLTARIAEIAAGAPARRDDPVAWLDAFERLGRVAAAGRLAALDLIDRTRAWQGEGHASMAHWTAERTGTTVGHAVGAVTAAKALSGLTATREALVSGRLSVQQTSEIATAAAADPGSEGALLGEALRSSAIELREKCRMVRVAAAGDDAYERVRRTRYFRHRLEDDGAVRVDARLPAEDAAPLLMRCHADADRRSARARRDGTREPYEAHMADALCVLARSPSDSDAAAAPRTTVMVHVDAAAWERGHARPGERCEIAGVGPTTVAAARRLAARPGGTLKIAARSGGNVTGVVSTGRYVPALVDSALEARDERCVIKGCTRRRGLERDHIVEFSRGGETSVANLQRLCGYHHSLKTHKGWRIVGTPPNCRMVPPKPEPDAPP
ncbi:MAG TPA: HNH endonuclease [Actinomycetota bacterium]|nr:HNH endonuclease [Actinomycetota bacterium]